MRKLIVAVATSIAVLVGSCACLKEENKHTGACVIVNDAIDCTKEAVKSLIPHLLPLVEFLLGGANGDPHWQDYLVSLESIGLDAVACTAQEVENNQAASVAGIPDAPDMPEGGRLAASKAKAEAKAKATAIHANFAKWRSARLPPNTVIKTK